MGDLSPEERARAFPLFMPEWGNEIIKLEAVMGGMMCHISHAAAAEEATHVQRVRMPRLKTVRLIARWSA